MSQPCVGRRLRRAAVALVLMVGLSGCSGGDDAGPAADPSLTPATPEAAASAPEPPKALASFYDQQVTWKDCRQGDRCTTIEVPLDYDHPAARSITLSVLKVPAAVKSQRVGSLVVNPGGPGGSGVDYAANADTYFGDELRSAFDIVGFDPRGVGRSTPIDCLTDDQLDTFVASDPDPDTAAERAESDRLLAEFGTGCVEHSGDLAAHVSTIEAAKDIDILRAVLGDDRLNYFGASYGTFLGATYADLFPERVGRMVLDGALDPAVSTVQLNLVQAKGFETALRAYAGHCVDAGGCFLGDSVEAATQRIAGFLDQVDAHPLPGSESRQLTVGNAVLGIWAPLYNKDYWPYLDIALKTAFAGQGQALLALSDAYTSRGPEGYLDNSTEALYAVNCLDRDDQILTEDVDRYLPRFEKASPTFGAIFAYSLAGCSEWPIHTGRGAAPIHAEGAAPIVVVGTSRDPATPLVWAKNLAAELDSGVLVTRDGDGHTGYGAGNTCVDHAVELYLVSGDVPEDGLAC